MEQHPEIIPQEIREADIIGGDLNQMNSGLEKIANVYHIINVGKYIERIEQPRSISDHLMLLFTKEFYIDKENTDETINILDKYTIKENYENLIKYITE